MATLVLQKQLLTNVGHSESHIYFLLFSEIDFGQNWTVTCGIFIQNLTRKMVLMSVYFFEVDFVSSIVVYQTLVQRNHG